MKQCNKVDVIPDEDGQLLIKEGNYGRIGLRYKKRGEEGSERKTGYLLMGVGGKTNHFPANQEWCQAIYRLGAVFIKNRKNWFIPLSNLDEVHMVLTPILEEAIYQQQKYKDEARRTYRQNHAAEDYQRREARRQESDNASAVAEDDE